MDCVECGKELESNWQPCHDGNYRCASCHKACPHCGMYGIVSGAIKAIEGDAGLIQVIAEGFGQIRDQLQDIAGNLELLANRGDER